MNSFYYGLMLVFMVAGCGAPSDKGAAAAKAMAGFATPVVAVKVTPQVVLDKVTMVGSLAANESIEVRSQIESKITEIHFDEGQKVAKGDVLLVLDREKLQANLAMVQSSLDIAQSTFTRMKALVGQGAVSKQEFDQAQAELASKKAQVDLITAQLGDTVIKAPFEGYVGERQVSLGQVINKEKLLTVLIDENPMKVDFHVPERYMARVTEGQEVLLTVAAYPKEEFKGQVYFLDPQVDELTRTFLVKAKIDNPESKLRRGMFAKIDLIVDQKPQALMVPEAALIPKAEEVYVFTVDQDNKAQMTLVKTGIRQSGNVEILSGLKAGDIIIIEGYQKIGPGSAVAVSY
ncbi:MAG: efflux RND transporter periplasmic adaptor subunit [Candidatus Omnitrophica bacterium]|nr:efflux RND transporter periplasmic adaptor subunit [Candidatus Omnitrophota bacterium]